jgi:hypothetical protein
MTPVLYLVFINHFATNSFFGDDWSVVLFVHPALHGQLSIGELWNQYNESRLFLGNIVDVVFGSIDRLNLRAVIFFNAGVYIASYAGLLVVFGRYLGRRLTPIPILSIGVVWFSLADVQNSLWAFQVSWYLTLFFLVLMLLALFVPTHHRTLWLIVAILAAVGGSLATVQGFLLWPLGLISLLWARPVERRQLQEAAAWIGAMICTAIVYFPGYNFSNNGCQPASSCSPSIAFHHPVSAIRYFFALIGNVVPGGLVSYPTVRNAGRFELVGAVLFAVGVFIIRQSWRHRASHDRIPLPLLLITFSLAFDVTVALGRSGIGPAGAVNNNRYVMANLVLLVGIVIYIWKPPLMRAGRDNRRVYAYKVALVALTIFLVVQVKTATSFGLTNGRITHSFTSGSARFFVNLDRLPPPERSCATRVVLFFQPGAFESFSLKLAGAVEDKLGEFQPGTYHYYRAQGPQAVPPNCLTKAAG